jgi:hypothetical protein
MKLILALMIALAVPLPLHAQEEEDETLTCYAEYKARKGPPLKLHYGIIALEGEACEKPRLAKREIEERIAVDDWDLLKVMDVFVVGDTVTRRAFRKKRADAGKFFLRY